MSDESGERCLNCDAPTGDHRFCPECGQEHTAPVLSVRDLLHQFADDVLSLDSKIVRTVVPLLIRPGFLTQEYLRGRRARYVRPLRLYLVTSLLYFLAVSLLGEADFVTSTSNDGLRVSTSGQADTDSDSDSAIDSADSAAAGDSVDTADPDAPDDPEIATVEEARDALGRVVIPDPERRRLALVFEDAGLDSTWIEAASPDTSSGTTGLEAIPVIGERLARGASRLSALDRDEAERQFNAIMLRNLPKAIFLLVPVFALVLRLYYVRRQRRYVEHLVFALHVHAFAFVALIPETLIDWEPLAVVVALSVPVYLFMAMRRVYAQGVIKTLLKLGGLMSVYVVLLVLTIAVLALLTLLTV